MAKKTVELEIKIDPTFQSGLDELSKALEFESEAFRQRLKGLLERFGAFSGLGKFLVCDRERDLTVGAGKNTVFINVTDSFRELLVALRALKRDFNIID